MTTVNTQISDTRDFLGFLKSKFPLIHNSNLFFRDLHYGTMAYFVMKRKRVSHAVAERIARETAERLEREGILRRIDHQSWCLNFPDYALPRIEKNTAPAK